MGNGRSDAVIRLTELSKRYGTKTALDGVSLAVEHGSVVGFLGPNGSGKTTAIRILMGLLSATGGRAEVLGRTVTMSSWRVRADIGYLPGTLRMPENMTGGEFLRFASRLRGGRGGASIEPLAERFSVGLDNRIAEMSKGTRQKIGVIQAFMHEPKVLLLDEPTSGLDPLVQKEFDGLLRERVRLGAAALLSSHVMSEVERTADTVAILNEGRLVASGPVTDTTARMGRRLSFEFATPVAHDGFRKCHGVQTVHGDGTSVSVSVAGPETEVLALAARLGAITVTSHEPSLDEVFLAVTGGDRGA
jgi:ABC-2 type transport system ATP-binding protein